MAKLSLIHSADGGNLAVAAPFFAPNSVDQPRGLDWVHPSVECRDAGQMGLGLFANEFIPRTTPVLFFGGKIMTWREITTLPEDMWDIPFQVTDELFFGIHRRDDIGLGERINHSCNPNTGFTSEMRLIALRDIHPNQQVTMDYATCSSMQSYRLECRCGEPNCRRVITGDDWKHPLLQARLGRYYQPYLKEKCERRGVGKVRLAIASLFQKMAGVLAKSI